MIRARRTCRRLLVTSRAGDPLLAQGLDKFGRFDREARDHDPKREIDLHRDNQRGLKFNFCDMVQP
jgi:hypothetical protein